MQKRSVQKLWQNLASKLTVVPIGTRVVGLILIIEPSKLTERLSQIEAKHYLDSVKQ